MRGIAVANMKRKLKESGKNNDFPFRGEKDNLFTCSKVSCRTKRLFGDPI